MPIIFLNLTLLFSFLSEHGLRPDHKAAARVAVRPPHFRQSSIRRLPLRDLVHGFRHRPGVHLPLLALTRLRGHPDPIRGRLRHQPHFGDLRLLLQLQVHQADRAHKGQLILSLKQQQV